MFWNYFPSQPMQVIPTIYSGTSLQHKQGFMLPRTLEICSNKIELELERALWNTAPNDLSQVSGRARDALS